MTNAVLEHEPQTCIVTHMRARVYHLIAFPFSFSLQLGLDFFGCQTPGVLS